MFLTFRFIKERKIESQDIKRRERGKEKQEYLTFKVKTLKLADVELSKVAQLMCKPDKFESKAN